MKSKFNYQVLLSKVARNQYKLHDLKQEWKTFILLVLFIKVLTWFISIYAGTNWFLQISQAMISNRTIAASLAILVLIAIEMLTNKSLAKFFKFLFRGVSHISTTISLALLVVFFFGVSFYTSTNGLAMRQSKKVDNTEIIKQREKVQKRQTENEYDGRFTDIDKQVALIENNPQGWSGGKRTMLLTAQTHKIDSLLREKSNLLQKQKDDLLKVEAQATAELDINKQQTTAEANKYYNIVMVIMIIQFISSGMLMFFWKIIWKQDDEPGVISEFTKELKETVETNIFQVFKNYMATANNAITLELQKESEQQQFVLPIDEAKEQTSSDKNAQTIGFRNRKDQSQKPVAKNTEQSKRFEGSANLRPVDMHKKNIEFLNKHKAIVKGIKLVKLAEKESIANSEIKQVQAVVKRAKHKGRTLIREVYKVAVTVGLNKIDDNGNVTF